MRIEALFPELCNLFGDAMNVEYLHRCLPEAEFIKTSMKERPKFLDGDVDLVYMGSMTESGQELAAGLLMPHRERILELIDSGKVFLVTGNALDIFGTRIENEDGSFFEGLGLFKLFSKRQMMKRYSSIYLGTFGDMDIVGFKSQFAHNYEDGGEGARSGGIGVGGDAGGIGGGTSAVPMLFNTLRGAGRKPGVTEEGVRLNNFFATNMLGPLLLINPPFTRYLLGLLGVSERELPYEKEAMIAYNARVAEFKDPNTGAEY